MRDEAKANEAHDKAERERIDKLNAADGMIFSTEKQLKEYGDKIPADKRATIEAALGKLKEAHKEGKVDQLDSLTTELQNAWQAASQDIYASQGAPGADAGSAQQSSQPNDSNVTDVEFEEVK